MKNVSAYSRDKLIIMQLRNKVMHDVCQDRELTAILNMYSIREMRLQQLSFVSIGKVMKSDFGKQQPPNGYHQNCNKEKQFPKATRLAFNWHAGDETK
ncbi:hypothetical protein RRG08_014801 [Elysia crispata]|uniref:Uncharacterized protein n=1 Tax=Elysia crispata TaxID=231223 RepID=A0AAE1AUK6_9GAST|nr:hypothetical protein RRG08_014801 [Elysia crispata]